MTMQRRRLAVDPLGYRLVDPQLLWQNSWSITGQTHKKTDVNLCFMITNSRIAGSRSLTRRMNFKFMSVRILTIKISQWARVNFCSYRRKHILQTFHTTHLGFSGPVQTKPKNLKCSFIWTVRPTVHTNPSRKRNFSKPLFKLKEFENALGLCFSVNGKSFENEAFRDRWHHENNVISRPRFPRTEI